MRRLSDAVLALSVVFFLVGAGRWLLKPAAPSGIWRPSQVVAPKVAELASAGGPDTWTIIDVLAVDCVWSRISVEPWNAVRDSIARVAPTRVVAISFSDENQTRTLFTIGG